MDLLEFFGRRKLEATLATLPGAMSFRQKGFRPAGFRAGFSGGLGFQGFSGGLGSQAAKEEIKAWG